MPTIESWCRPVQIMIAVDDIQASVAFYQALLGQGYEVTQRTEHEDFSTFVFGEYGRDDFFLLTERSTQSPDLQSVGKSCYCFQN